MNRHVSSSTSVVQAAGCISYFLVLSLGNSFKIPDEFGKDLMEYIQSSDLSFCQKASGKESKPFVDSYFLNTSRDKPILGYLRLYSFHMGGQIIHKRNFKPGQISSKNLCSSFLKLFSSEFFFLKRGTKNEKFEREEWKKLRPEFRNGPSAFEEAWPKLDKWPYMTDGNFDFVNALKLNVLKMK